MSDPPKRAKNEALLAAADAIGRQAGRMETRLRWDRYLTGEPPDEGEDQPRDWGVLATASRAARIIFTIAAHTLVTAVLVSCIWGIHILLHALGDPRLFGYMPVSYALDAMDLAILVVYVFYGVADVRKTLSE